MSKPPDMPPLVGAAECFDMEAIDKWLSVIQDAGVRLTIPELLFATVSLQLSAGFVHSGMAGRAMAASVVVDLLCQNVPGLRRAILKFALEGGKDN